MTVARKPTTMSELLSEKAAERRQRAAILRHRMGRDHRARRRLDLGQDRDRSPRRSRAGAEQARHLPEQVAAARASNTSLTLQNGYNVIQQGIVPVPGIAGAAGAELSDRAVGEAEHRRHRHQLYRRTDAVLHRRQMAAQDRRRTETVRRRQHLRLDRRNPAGRHQQEPHRGIQAQLVDARRRLTRCPCEARRPANDRALPQIGPDAVKIGSPDGPLQLSSCGGHPRSLQTRNRE